ncbi:MAG: flagellar hook assembly protein FlgD [Chromatocurvus sp.]
MTDISAIQDLFARQPQAAERNRDELGQQDFLRLMTTQLQNQDPFKPMENGDFLAQMAQFSTVSGIDKLQATFTDTADALTGSQALQAASLVDRQVLVPSSQGRFDGENPLAGAVSVPEGASGGLVAVMNAQGQTVAQLPLIQGPGGRATFQWDGADGDGKMAPPGDYRLEARYRVGRETEAAEPLVWGRVDSVSLKGPGGGISINVAGMGAMSLSRALEIS